MDKPKIAVHKFTSCDGCQLSFLNAGLDLITLNDLIEIVHFAEAGALDPTAKVDIAFIEGSISTPQDLTRIQKIRDNSGYLITIGACATSGGIQALRNFVDHKTWMQAVYASPEYIKTLENSTAIAKHVKVDFEIWGCPVTTQQVLQAIRALLFGVTPVADQDAVCLQCKRENHVCVLVTKKQACLGPVTQTGCGAICPSVGRGCYGCFSPKENPNMNAMINRLQGFGLVDDEIARKFQQINNQADGFQYDK